MKRSLTTLISLALGTGLMGIAHAQGVGAPGYGAPSGQPQNPAPYTQPQEPAPGMPPAAVPGVAPGSPGGAATAPAPVTSAKQLSRTTIEQAQQQLQAKGLYTGPIDGRPGPMTRTAIRKFQRQSGLPQTAMFDRRTLRRLLGHASSG